MATISIRGKEKVLSHYKNVNQPYWKLYNVSDLKTPIQQFVTGRDKKIDTPLRFLNDILDSIDPNGTYVLDTYEYSDDKSNQQRFLKPDTSICFTLSDTATAPQVNGTEVKRPTFDSSPASLKDHIDLIKENAKLSMECSLYKSRYEDCLKEISELKSEIDELNDELEDYEEEEEEQEQESVAGTQPPKNMEEALSRLMTEHGGVLIENLMSKGVKGDPGKSDISGDDDEGEIKVNGSGDMPDMNTIVTELQRYDPNFQKHLYKLMLIAQQKPSTFKMFLSKLENF